MNPMRFGPTLLAQADRLAQFTEDPPGITRTFLSAQHKAAGDYLIGLMRDAGMTAAFDALGNVVGRYASERPNAPIVMTGSHIDSVRNAGRYDGLFGVLSAIACVKDLDRRGRKLPYTLEVVGFGDEEGVRFGVALVGSKAMTGAFDPAWLDKTDDDGVTMRDALAAFGERMARARSAWQERRRVCRIAHRAGTGSAERRLGAWGRHRDRRRHAVARAGDRTRRACGNGADGTPPRCACRRERNGSRPRATL
jgi:peptidase M20/M25/M40-like protein